MLLREKWRVVGGFLLVVVVSVGARWLYICNMPPDSYAVDLYSWREVGNILLAGGNPYNLTPYLNWPPFWMQLIYLFSKLSLATHVPFDHVVQGFLISAEIVLSLLLYMTVIKFTEFKRATWLLVLGVALNPVPILLVCQHCNFDVLVGFWVLLAVHALLRYQDHHEPRFWLLACFSLGMGAVTKSVPLSLAPLLALSIRKLKFTEQALGVAFLLLPIVLALSIVYVLGPRDIEAKVFNYRSIPGYFGLPGLLAHYGEYRLLAAYPRSFEIIYGTGWGCTGLWLLRKDTLTRRQIVSLAIVILLAIPTFGPGYGPQYVYWFLPLLLLLYAMVNARVRVLLIALYCIGAVTYVIEYALFPSHGAYLLHASMAHSAKAEPVFKLAEELFSPSGQTMLRLPLWIVYSAVIVFLSAPFVREMVRDFQSLRFKIEKTNP